MLHMMDSLYRRAPQSAIAQGRVSGGFLSHLSEILLQFQSKHPIRRIQARAGSRSPVRPNYSKSGPYPLPLPNRFAKSSRRVLAARFFSQFPIQQKRAMPAPTSELLCKIKPLGARCTFSRNFLHNKKLTKHQILVSCGGSRRIRTIDLPGMNRTL